jgi:hypothetical protein
MQVPVTVLNANTKRETGKKAQEGNIAAAKVRSGVLLVLHLGIPFSICDHMQQHEHRVIQTQQLSAEALIHTNILMQVT